MGMDGELVEEVLRADEKHNSWTCTLQEYQAFDSSVIVSGLCSTSSRVDISFALRVDALSCKTSTIDGNGFQVLNIFQLSIPEVG